MNQSREAHLAAWPLHSPEGPRCGYSRRSRTMSTCALCGPQVMQVVGTLWDVVAHGAALAVRSGLRARLSWSISEATLLPELRRGVGWLVQVASGPNNK